DIARNDVEERLGGGRKEADVELGVEEERRDIGAVKDILQIVGGRTLPLQRFLKLAVQSGQLLGERLQLFLRGQKYLIGGLEFLVCGQGFFVDRLLLFVGNLKIANRTQQFRPRGLEFLLEFSDPRSIPRHGAMPSLLFIYRLVDEADQQQGLALAQNRMHGYVERALSLARAAAVDDNTQILLSGPLYGRSKLNTDVGTHHGEQIARGMASRHTKVAIGWSQIVETFMFAVDQHCSRRIIFHHKPPAELGECGLARWRRVLPGARGHAQAVADAQREAEFARSAAADVPVDSLGLGDRFKTAVGVDDGFRATEQKNATLAQRKMEKRDNLRLRFGEQINEKVAT